MTKLHLKLGLDVKPQQQDLSPEAVHEAVGQYTSAIGAAIDRREISSYFDTFQRHILRVEALAVQAVLAPYRDCGSVGEQYSDLALTAHRAVKVLSNTQAIIAELELGAKLQYPHSALIKVSDHFVLRSLQVAKQIQEQDWTIASFDGSFRVLQYSVSELLIQCEELLIKTRDAEKYDFHSERSLTELVNRIVDDNKMTEATLFQS